MKGKQRSASDAALPLVAMLLPAANVPFVAPTAPMPHGKPSRTAVRSASPRGAAPPGTAPPGTAPPRDIPHGKAPPPRVTIGTAAQGPPQPTPHTKGQQIEISGHVLDAATAAKELPAHTNGTAVAPQQAVRTVLPLHMQMPETASEHVAPAHPNDLLGRMLARASRAQHASTQQHASPQLHAREEDAPQTPSPTTTRSVPTAPAATTEILATKLASLLGETIAKKHAARTATASLTPSASTSNASSLVLPGHTAQLSAAPIALAPPAPAYTPVDPEAILSQIVRGIVVSNVGGAQEVRLKLHPDHLGEVAMKLNVAGTTVTATFSAQNADVRNVIALNQSHLSRALADAGMKLAGFSVDVSGGNTRGFPNERDASGKMGRRYAVLETAAATEPTAGTPAIASLASGIDASLLDYLA